MRHLWFWVRLISAVSVLWYVVAKNGQGRIVTVLLSAQPTWILLAGILFFLSVIAGAYQWHLLLRIQGIEFRFRDCFRTYYSGMFLNNFLPGTIGGDALRVYEVQKGMEGWGKAAAATFLDRLIGFFSLSLLSLIAVTLSLWRNNLDHQVFRHLLVAVSVIFACFVLALIFLLSRRIASLTHSVVQWTNIKWLDDSYTRLQDILTAYRARYVGMGYVVLVSCVVQILRINVHWFSAIGLGIGISPVFFFCFIPIIALAGVIPLNVGGWGIPQSIGTYLYTLPGVLALTPLGNSQSDIKVTAAALAFLPSVVGLVVMLGGGFYFVTGKAKS
jgi:glycosyltransferase 2 family protein